MKGYLMYDSIPEITSEVIDSFCKTMYLDGGQVVEIESKTIEVRIGLPKASSVGFTRVYGEQYDKINWN